MSVNHSVSDLVALLKNGQMANRKKVTTPSSKLRKAVLDILVNEGYVAGYEERGDKKPELDIELRYHNAKPVIREIKVLSKPGKRAYCGVKEIPSVYDGLGIVILSTSKGVMPCHEARANELGGELLLKIF